jgi:hypothetical protein
VAEEIIIPAFYFSSFIQGTKVLQQQRPREKLLSLLLRLF